tara:strand:- start:495 stop:1328 length:834 start_codon:yes stop_codon:yes gene_type:complete
MLSLSFEGNEQSLNIELRKKLWMIIGEGAVFISLVILGSFFIRKYVLREHRMAQQERNFLLATTHELNSPIAAAKLNLQTLKRLELNQEQKEQMVESGLSNISRLEKLVHNILTASRIDVGKFQIVRDDVDLRKLLERIIERHSIQLKESNLNVVLTVPDNTKIQVDLRALELVFENLLFNAVKYASGADFGISSMDLKKYTRIEVYDTGLGVESAQLKMLFRKFFRAENEETRTQKGTGLGLYLVKEVIRLHKGSIIVKNNEPTGLRFIIDLPHNK